MGQAWAARPYACVGVSAGLKLKADRLAPQLCRGFPRSSAGDWSKRLRRTVVNCVGLSLAVTSRSDTPYRFCSIRLFLFDTAFSIPLFAQPCRRSEGLFVRGLFGPALTEALLKRGTGFTRDMVVRLKTATSMSEASTRYPFSAPSCKRSNPAAAGAEISFRAKSVQSLEFRPLAL